MIDNVVVSDADSQYASIIAGLAESAIEDVRFSNIRIHYKGGGTKEDAARVVPENEKSYPEPSMFGTIPAYGFYVRHAKGITFDNVEVSFANDDARPAFVLDDVISASFFRIKAQTMPGVKTFSLTNVSDFSLWQSWKIKDTQIDRAEKQQF
jgi:hypothetical protein